MNGQNILWKTVQIPLRNCGLVDQEGSQILVNILSKRNVQFYQLLNQLLLSNVIPKLSIERTTVRNEGSRNSDISDQSSFKVSQLIGSFVPSFSFILKRVDQSVCLVDGLLLLPGLFLKLVLFIIVNFVGFIKLGTFGLNLSQLLLSLH